jgi:hypothetical protein
MAYRSKPDGHHEKDWRKFRSKNKQSVIVVKFDCVHKMYIVCIIWK